jgi:hypothetical protein
MAEIQRAKVGNKRVAKLTLTEEEFDKVSDMFEQVSDNKWKGTEPGITTKIPVDGYVYTLFIYKRAENEYNVFAVSGDYTVGIPTFSYSIRYNRIKPAKEVFEGLLYIKEQTEENCPGCLEAVRQNGNALENVEHQTEEICLEAVRQNGWALEFVENQTEEICLEAVRDTGYALQFVENQTEAICLEAVRGVGTALEFVENQTPEICLEAVKRDGEALEFVENQTPEIVIEALKNDRLAFQFVDDSIVETVFTSLSERR